MEHKERSGGVQLNEGDEELGRWNWIIITWWWCFVIVRRVAGERYCMYVGGVIKWRKFGSKYVHGRFVEVAVNGWDDVRLCFVMEGGMEVGYKRIWFMRLVEIGDPEEWDLSNRFENLIRFELGWRRMGLS